MATTKLSGAEIASQVLIGEISYAWKKGVDAASLDIAKASAHPPMRVLRAYVTLAVAPDSAGTTITAKLQNNGTDMTDVLTFTQGSEAVGSFKVFALTANQNVVLSASAITLVVAGTTATLGSIIVTLIFENP